MNRTASFVPIKSRLISVLVSVLLLTAFPLMAMVSPMLAVVNAPNPLNATYPRSKPSASKPLQSESPHTMTATYYSFKGNLKATINLNNKGLVPLEVKPTLFSLAGERLEVRPVTVEATTFQVFDLAEWAGAGGPTFQQGSLQLFYRGKDMLLGAQIKIVDSASSVIFDEQLGEPTNMYSSRLEGLWWLPTNDSQVSIAISNTTDSIQVASIDMDGIEPKQQGSKELVFQAHQTVLVDPARDWSDRPAVMQETGGISINHSGKPGSLSARAMIQNPITGFSSAVQFADPGKAKSSKLHGAGLRLGEIGGEELTPVVVARNVSDVTAVLHGRIRYTKRDGGAGVTPLREIKLRPGEVKAWEIAEVSRPQSVGVESAGLEIDYSTQPGSVIVSALSVSRSGNHVFHVPMLDVAAQKSSTGAYPFYLYGTSSTVVYIKNTTAVEQKYVAHLNYEGGNYRMGLKTIAPGETVTIDIRALRDSQIPDDEELTIPPDVAHGQVRWTLIQGKGTDPLSLIGRAEQVDEVKAVSSTYACQNCCGDFFEEAYISPSPVQIQVGQSATLRAFERRADCYGFTYPIEQTASWNSSNPSVATVPSGPVTSAQVTSIGAGQTTITATWNSYCSIPTQCGGSGFFAGPIGGCCGTAPFFRSASATVGVVGVSPSVSISGPNVVPLGTDVNTIQLTASGNPTGGTYVWSTTSPRVTLTNTSSATVTVRSVNQSSSQNDVTINLAYSVNVQTAHTLTTLTVQKPTSLGFVTTTSQGTASGCATGSTGWERNIRWQVLDQFSQAMRYAGMRVTDAITLGTPNTCGASNPLVGTGFTDSTGQFPDRYSFCSPGCVSGNCQLSASQGWTVNGIGLTSATNVFYTCTSITLNGQ